jgi:c-di-AMP phosphodiesterase-like protein
VPLDLLVLYRDLSLVSVDDHHPQGLVLRQASFELQDREAFLDHHRLGLSQQ